MTQISTTAEHKAKVEKNLVFDLESGEMLTPEEHAKRQKERDNDLDQIDEDEDYDDEDEEGEEEDNGTT